ncbi:MAG TPA: ribonuclease H-like domain-containing protein [Candidatus Obscuribacterales bacterium]
MKLEAFVKLRKPDLYEQDLPEERFRHYMGKPFVAVDTETRGLNVLRDRLCLVQLCDEEGMVSLVRYRNASAPRLKELLEAGTTLKVFHYARFDLAVLKHYLNCQVEPIFCTKAASKLVRTYTDRHSLKDLGRELLGLEMDKSDQMSDWAREDLTESQLEYAANDVRVLIPIYRQVEALLEREGRKELAERVFKVLPVVAELDLGGWKDVFEH